MALLKVICWALIFIIKILKQIQWPRDCIFLLQGIFVKIKWSYYTLKVYNYKDAGVIQGAGGAMQA